MIVPVVVNRDEHRYGTHPALTRNGCETPAEFSCPKGASDELV